MPVLARGRAATEARARLEVEPLEVLLSLPDLRRDVPVVQKAAAQKVAPTAPHIVHEAQAAPPLQVARVQASPESQPVESHWHRVDPPEAGTPPVSHEAWKLAMRRVLERRDALAVSEKRKLWLVTAATAAAMIFALLVLGIMLPTDETRLPTIPSSPPAYSKPTPPAVHSDHQTARRTVAPHSVTPVTGTPMVDSPTHAIPAPVLTLPETQTIAEPRDVPPWERWPSDKAAIPPSSKAAAANEPATLQSKPDAANDEPLHTARLKGTIHKTKASMNR
jgi:hypothetical protein